MFLNETFRRKSIFQIFIVEALPGGFLIFYKIMAVAFQKCFSTFPFLLRSSCSKQALPALPLSFARYYASKKGKVYSLIFFI